MSLRLLSTKLARHGRYFLQSFWKREIYTNILEQQHNRTRNRLPTTTATALRLSASVPVKQTATTNAFQAAVAHSGKHQANGIFRFGQHARKIFVDNILNRCTTTYSEPLRSQAIKKLFYGDSAPFFALIGVSLASGAGVLTKEDELEGVCWEIREAAARLQHSWNYDDISDTLNSDFNIDKLDVGPPLAKGCAAVVYAAAFKNENLSKADIGNIETTDDLLNSARSGTTPDMAANVVHNNFQQLSFRPELMSPMQNMSRFVHNFGGSVDNLQIYNQSTAASDFVEGLATLQHEHHDNKHEDTTERLHSAIGATGLNRGMQDMTPVNTSVSIDRYPLALKLMFNYDIQSNALAILRGMYKETVPARQRYINASAEEWERLIENQTLTLPPHPNIVTMFGFFCDEVRNFPDGHLLYPIAQPQRINPLGYGRNMSLYLLMKRYDFNLRSLLDTHNLKTRTQLLLFAQLLEAVVHINRHGIAHRDLKSDNILIELNDDDSPPILVLSDFGCCLADKLHGLQIPFTSYDIDKGGNAALMAPEIINKQPGAFAVLNYAKADLWACGAIAYEIFGLPNPFYSTTAGMAMMRGEQTYSLRNCDYKQEHLPPLSDACPELIQQLIYNILDPNPSKRVSPDIAANVLQLFLWAPSKWLKQGGIPNSPEILQWLLSLTTKIMCEGRSFNVGGLNDQLNFNQTGRRTFVEYLLICSFLARANLRRIRGALNWIQNTI